MRINKQISRRSNRKLLFQQNFIVVFVKSVLLCLYAVGRCKKNSSCFVQFNGVVVDFANENHIKMQRDNQP